MVGGGDGCLGVLVDVVGDELGGVAGGDGSVEGNVSYECLLGVVEGKGVGVLVVGGLLEVGCCCDEGVG